MAINTVDALFTNELKDIYDAEKRLTRAIPKMAKTAASAELRKALEEHLTITKNQVARLEDIFHILEVKPQGRTCEAMKGLISEGEEVMEEKGPEQVCDLALVGAGRRVEHYEMAAYKSLLALADALEDSDRVRNMLTQTLEEEEEADKSLAAIAGRLVNDTIDGEAGEEKTAPARRSS